MDRAERFGIGSLVLGILGLLLLISPFGIIFSILAIVLGHPKIVKDKTKFSKIGLILGIIGTVLHVILRIIGFLFLSSLAFL